MLNPADAAFAEHLATRLPDGTLREAAPAYLEEPRQKWKGRKGFVATPADTETVAEIVRACAAARVGIVPYSGGTGLVGGQISTDGPVPLILSLENMSAIRKVYPRENALVAEAGVTIAAIQAAAEAENRLFPLSYASQDTARIGGGLSVNSGGLNVLRYGMARDLCLGIEAVLPDGSILRGLKRLRKDNTGYDLRHLLIGAEGTLGIITAATLKLVPRPTHTATAFLEVSSPAAALDLLALLQDRAGDVVSAFELIAGTGLEMMAEVYPDTRQPFPEPPEWSVLVEIGTSDGSDPEALLAHVFEDALSNGLVRDGIIASSGAQQTEFWTVRETIPAANRTIGAVASHDISLPLSEIEGFIAEATPAIAAIGAFRINTFGHLGDGNLHFNIFPPKGQSPNKYPAESELIARLVHDIVAEKGGSFSAEHGIGRMKTNDLLRYGDPTKLAAMRAIKTALDPLGIMNPGAIFASE